MKNTSWGNKAYKATRANGGSKQEAKIASANASDKYIKHVQQQQFGKNRSFESNINNFNDSKNDGCWHTSDDL